jgi:hypothetical protein
VPARLTVNGSKFKLGKKIKKLDIAVTSRRQSLLQMTVTAAGVRTSFAANVKRG